MLYIREAHPTDGRQAQANVRDKVLVRDPRAIKERRKVAREFAAQFKVSLPVFVDTMDDRVNRAYSAWPDRLYVIDGHGRIAYKGGPGPRRFRVAEVPPVLDRLLGPRRAGPVPADNKPSPPPPGR